MTLTKKSIAKSVRLTQEVFDYIDSAPGNGFNEKFENIILEAKRGESDRKKELARLDKQIEKQRRKQTLLFEQLTNFDCFLNSFEDAQKLLRNLKNKLNDVHLMAQRIEEVEKEIDYDEQI